MAEFNSDDCQENILFILCLLHMQLPWEKWKVLQLQLFRQCKFEVFHMHQYNHDDNEYCETTYSWKWINKKAIYKKLPKAERQTTVNRIL